MKLARYHNSVPSNRYAGLESFFGFSPFFDFANRVSTRRSDLPELYEDDENFYARFEIPGVDKSDLNVELNNGQLEITAESASRSITVPEGVDPEKVEATLENGILTVQLGKTEAQKPRSIEVK